MLKDMHKLFEPPGISGLGETALFDTAYWRYFTAGKVVFFKRLQQMLR
jgi:hypothetical protein